MKWVVSQKQARKQRVRLRILAGLCDFFGTIGSFVVILVCIVLLTTLIAWLRQDIVQTLSWLLDWFSSAIVTPSCIA